MVDLLVSLHAGEEFGLDVVVGPAQVEVQVHHRVRLHVPPVLLSDMFDDSVLGFWVGESVPATLMTILCFLVENWFL